jgi:hypothetical protein
MAKRTREFPQGYPRQVAQQICEAVEQDQAAQTAQAAQREAECSPIARQEIERTLQATVREYEAIRQINGGQPYTLEEKQALMQQLKRHVYSGPAARKDENQQVNERFLQFLTDEGLDPGTINTYATALQELQQWYGKPLPPNPYDVFPEYVQHLRETGESQYKIENVRAMLKKLMRFERQESEAETEEVIEDDETDE